MVESKLIVEGTTEHVPQGFSLAGVACGIKRNLGERDLTLIRCDAPTTTVGVYTQNRVVAAPVVLDRQRTPSEQIRAVLVNSGNANACTGERGWQDALHMSKLVADACDVDPQAVLIMSTGVIGEFLPMANIVKGVRAASTQLARTPEALLDAAHGILTTDAGIKVSCRAVRRGGQRAGIMGIAKGAGMIAPNMATMLAIIMTDLEIPLALAQPMFSDIVEDTFNSMLVDGHTSTNDTALLLASGASGLRVADARDVDEILRDLCADLARAIADDGEGATHVMEIQVTGCTTHDDARAIARAVGNSLLVKTAVAGNDPNWGRIVSAAGYAGVEFDAVHMSLTVNGVRIFSLGQPLDFDAAELSRSMAANRNVVIALDLGRGHGHGRIWASDLTAEYVRINSAYRT